MTYNHQQRKAHRVKWRHKKGPCRTDETGVLCFIGTVHEYEHREKQIAGKTVGRSRVNLVVDDTYSMLMRPHCMVRDDPPPKIATLVFDGVGQGSDRTIWNCSWVAIEKNEAWFGGEEVRKVGVPLRKDMQDVVFELERYNHRDC